MGGGDRAPVLRWEPGPRPRQPRGRELPSPRRREGGGGGGRQAGERSLSHMVGWRRSRCPGNS